MKFKFEWILTPIIFIQLANISNQKTCDNLCRYWKLRYKYNCTNVGVEVLYVASINCLTSARKEKHITRKLGNFIMFYCLKRFTMKFIHLESHHEKIETADY